MPRVGSKRLPSPEWGDKWQERGERWQKKLAVRVNTPSHHPQCYYLPMEYTIGDIKSVCLWKPMEECSSQATGTRCLNQSSQPSMAMGGTSMELSSTKIDQGACSHLMFDSYHLCYVLLDLPVFFAYL